MQKTNAYAAGGAFALIVGFSFLFVKITLNYGEPLVVLAYRFDLALIAIGTLVACRVIKIDLRKPGFGWVIMAALTYGGFMLFQLLGLRFATSVEGGILFAIIPVVTMIIAEWFLKERTNMLQKVFVATSVTGVILLLLLSAGVLHLSGSAMGGGEALDVSLPGVVLLLISSISLAVSNTTVRHLRGRFTPMEISFVMVLTCAVLSSAIVLILGAVQGHLMEDIRLICNLPFLGAVAYLGVLSTFVSSFLLSYTMVRLKAVEGTLFGNVSTAISIVAGALIMGEPVYWYHIICTGLIIAGVLGTNMAGNRTVGKIEEETTGGKDGDK